MFIFGQIYFYMKQILTLLSVASIGNTGVTDHPFPEQIDHPKIWRKVVNLIGEV
jgi:hypothetical protein